MKNHLIHIDATIYDAMRAFDDLSGGNRTLIVVDDQQRLQGTLTEGDVRRAFFRGATLGSPVSEAVHTQCRTVAHGNIDVKRLRDYRQNCFTLIPVVDDQGHITQILDLDTHSNHLPISAILMAGGKGERLRPLTNDTPKPLLEIDGRPIIDINIQALARVGINDIYVTTNYLAEKIHDHFAAPVAGVQVHCVREPAALGTIGSVALIPHPVGGHTLVMNSDLLTSISFEDLYIHHIDTASDVTIAAIPYVLSVPYAILQTDDQGRVQSLAEKPTYTHYANAGIYIFANHVLDTIAPGTHIDATELIENAIASGMKVSYFPITGTWLDIGSPADFRQAQELMRHHRNLMG